MTEEYVDIVNEENEVTGQETRRTVHNSGLWHRGVHIFLFTPDHKLLVQQRSPTQDTFPGAFDCSVSEHLKVGELYLEGAIRGIREELGVEQIQLTRLLQFRMNYGLNDNMVSELYEGVCDNENLQVDPSEVAQISYYLIPEIEEMMASGGTAFTPWFVQLLRWYTGKLVEMQVFWERA